VKDFEAIALIADTPAGAIAGRASLPANNLKELIAWLKENPDKRTMGSVGVAGPSDLSATVFQQAHRHELSARAVSRRRSVVAGISSAGQIDMGLFSGLGLLWNNCAPGPDQSLHRSSQTPDARPPPTFQRPDEAGRSRLLRHRLARPSGRRRALRRRSVAKLNAAVVQSLADPGLVKRFADLGQGHLAARAAIAGCV